MSVQDRMTDEADWKEGINAFREEMRERLLLLLERINELELIIEELANARESGNKEG